MSGIAGIIHFDSAPVALELVEHMTSAIANRGMDGINHWSRGSVAFGQCMLRTTPESLEEHQPLINEHASLILVLDGRVDNWMELRRELIGRGALLRDRSDAELVLRAYEAWGRNCLHHIDGDFAFVIWDAKRQEAFCARDRVGNKPLYYRWDGRTFAFASELHPILALPWVKQEFNEGLLAEFLAAEWYSQDETFWLGIMRLVAGHHMAVGAGGTHLAKYWEPDLGATLQYTKDEEFAEHYRELFTDVVRRMSRSSQTLACEVSGGLDSSAIYAVAESLRRQRKLLAPALDGYALDFHDVPDANELEYSHALGRHLGVSIREIPPSIMQISWYRDRAATYRDFPGYPNGTMGLGIRAAARARGSNVLLVGIGGDEWLGGSRTYYAEALAAGRWAELFGFIKVDRDQAGLRSALWWLLRYGVGLILPAPVRGILRSMAASTRISGIDRERWLSPALKRAMTERRAKYRRPSGQEFRRIGQRGQFLILSSAMLAHARESEERLSSGLGLELRRPLFDPRMVQFSFMTPERLRLRGSTNKALHRQGMAGLLPEMILTRETKADFTITFHRPLAEMDALFNHQIPSRRGNWVKSHQVAALHAKYGDPNHPENPERMLWTLFGCDALC